MITRENFRMVSRTEQHDTAPVVSMDEDGQAERQISTGRLSALPRVHLRPINLVVFEVPSGRPRFGVGFALICFQRLSRPDIATLHCS